MRLWFQVFSLIAIATSIVFLTHASLSLEHTTALPQKKIIEKPIHNFSPPRILFVPSKNGILTHVIQRIGGKIMSSSIPLAKDFHSKLDKADGVVLSYKVMSFFRKEKMYTLPFQRVTPMLDASHITKKNLLVQNIRRMYAEEAWKITPLTFQLPEEMKLFQEKFDHLGGIWVLKKVKHKAQGLKLINTKPTEKELRDYALVQYYIADPLLIGGRKSHLRLYVVLTSLSPLRLYLHREGFMIFSTEEYTLNSTDISSKFSHLTNTFVGQGNQKYSQDPLPKWRLSRFTRFVAASGKDPNRVWGDIVQVLFKAIVSGVPSMRSESLSVIKNAKRAPNEWAQHFEVDFFFPFSFSLSLNNMLLPLLFIFKKKKKKKKGKKKKINFHFLVKRYLYILLIIF